MTNLRRVRAADISGEPDHGFEPQRVSFGEKRPSRNLEEPRQQFAGKHDPSGCPSRHTLPDTRHDGDPQSAHVQDDFTQSFALRSSPLSGATRRRSLAGGAVSAVGGTCRDGSHFDDCGLRRRGPAGRGAGPHRENCPEVGVPLRAARSWLLGVRAETGIISTIVVFVAAALRAAVPGPTGRTAQRSAFPERAARSRLLGVRAETGVISTIVVFVAAALRAAVPTGGPRSAGSTVNVPSGNAANSPVPALRWLQLIDRSAVCV